MFQYLLMAFLAIIFYKFFLKGIYWIISMKLKHGVSVNYWYFPVLGGLIKELVFLIVPILKYDNPHWNLVL
jgi:hypothetical protein